MSEASRRFSISALGRTLQVSETHGCISVYGWECPRCRGENIFALFSLPASHTSLRCSQCGQEVELRDSFSKGLSSGEGE